MAEKEQSGLLKIVAILGLIAVIAFGLIFGVIALKDKMNTTDQQTAEKVGLVANSRGDLAKVEWSDYSGLHVKLERFGDTVYATYSGNLLHTGAYTWVASVPDGYKPIDHIAADVKAGNGTINLMVRGGGSGRIVVWDKGTSDGQARQISGTTTWQTQDAMPKN